MTYTYSGDYKYDLEEYNKLMKSKMPIYKECPSRGELCFCTGVCHEVIGYVDRTKYDNFIKNNIEEK